MDIDLVDIKYYKDKANPSIIMHSTIQILRVLTPSDWGDNLSNPRLFFKSFDLPSIVEITRMLDICVSCFKTKSSSICGYSISNFPTRSLTSGDTTNPF